MNFQMLSGKLTFFCVPHFYIHLLPGLFYLYIGNSNSNCSKRNSKSFPLPPFLFPVPVNGIPSQRSWSHLLVLFSSVPLCLPRLRVLSVLLQRCPVLCSLCLHLGSSIHLSLDHCNHLHESTTYQLHCSCHSAKTDQVTPSFKDLYWLPTAYRILYFRGGIKLINNKLNKYVNYIVYQKVISDMGEKNCKRVIGSGQRRGNGQWQDYIWWSG